MILAETCPQCGTALDGLVLCTDPPMTCKNCPACGWHWEGELEPIVYRPFGWNEEEVQSDTDW